MVGVSISRGAGGDLLASRPFPPDPIAPRSHVRVFVVTLLPKISPVHVALDPSPSLSDALPCLRTRRAREWRGETAWYKLE